MAEPGKRCMTSARQGVGLLLLLAIASHASDATVDVLALQGTVVDAGTGLPVPGADVRHLSIEARFSSTGEDGTPPGWSATTDDEGHFTLADLPSRDVYLQITAEGYARSRGVRVPPDTNRLDIRLGKGATIEGTLSLVHGGPAMGEVRLSPADWPWWTSTQADPLGRFRFQNVPPGSYRMAVRSSSGIAEGRELRVAEGDHVAVELSLVQLGRVTGWISGLLEGESASIALHLDDEEQRYVRSSPHQDFGNGRFELRGVEDGAFVVKASAGGRTLSTRTEVAGGQGIADFAFMGRSQLSGRVLAGTRPLPRMNVGVVPLSAALPSAHMLTDEAGRFEFNGLGDGEYEVEVQLGPRGTSRSFAVTVFGETVFDVPLGPYSTSGRLAPGFRNHSVEARPLPADGEPVIHQAFVDDSGRYRFDGLEQGDYVVSHSSPYYDHVVEVRIFGASVEGVDLEPDYGETITVQVVDAVSGQQLPSLTCEIEEGPWAGLDFGLDDRPTLRIPVSLTNTGMTCTSRGYDRARLRWDRSPLRLELAPAQAGPSAPSD